MTLENKQLLLKDLCARLPYGVKCRFEISIDKYKTIEFSREETNGLLVDFDELYSYWLNEGFILPYLRPMSSMTEEEKKKLKEETCPNGTGLFDKHYLICPVNHYGEQISFEFMSDIINWLNAHHFDFRGLIEKGLALEAPEGMYKTE